MTKSMIEILLRMLAACGLSTLAVTSDGTAVAPELVPSGRQSGFCWTLYTAICLTNIGPLVFVRLPAGAVESNVPVHSIKLLFNLLAVLSAIINSRCPDINNYIRFIAKAQRQIGPLRRTAFDLGALLLITASVLTMLGCSFSSICFSFADCDNGYKRLGIVSEYILFIQFVLVHYSGIILVYVPTRLMRALAHHVEDITEKHDARKKLPSKVTGSMKTSLDIFVVDNCPTTDAGLLALLSRITIIQQQLRHASREVEERMSMFYLFLLVATSVEMFNNMLMGLVNLDEMDAKEIAVISVGLISCFMTCASICECCQQFILSDSRVSVALYNNSAAYAATATVSPACPAAASPAAPAAGNTRELWARLRLTCARARAPRFTAYRMLTLDRSLILVIVATVVTYVVLYSQLQVGSDEKKTPKADSY